MPVVQKPHCRPWHSLNAACIGCIVPSAAARPSIVSTLAPCTCAASMLHALTARPSTCTVHAPHCAVSQPMCVPVSPSVVRSRSESNVRESMSAFTDLALTVNAMGSDTETSLVEIRRRTAFGRDVVPGEGKDTALRERGQRGCIDVGSQPAASRYRAGREASRDRRAPGVVAPPPQGRPKAAAVTLTDVKYRASRAADRETLRRSIQIRDVLGQILDVGVGERRCDARHVAGVVRAPPRLEIAELLLDVGVVLPCHAWDLVLPHEAALMAHRAEHLVGFFRAGNHLGAVGLEAVRRLLLL